MALKLRSKRALADQTEDLRAIGIPTHVIQVDDHQVTPGSEAALKQIELLGSGGLKIYEGYPHGMQTMRADVINPELLAFVKA